MACRTGCPSQDHGSYADCLKGSGIKVGFVGGGLDLSIQKRWDRELADYRDLRKQGVQPAGTTRYAIDDAKRQSDALGQAYQAG
jgi:hypothetical protein